ncbi:hypothetical protein CALCODRAFT_489109 [Calocera cornea HHB12733]|uniref:DUF6532 domain-containing protein n=1 Tax=Calocera cornea HHB12733 TaxID=1353952 RepID=A0A166JMY2_9BASI|nr:hypothetical protein CALCODRAFT_489109 [Calocera cornea HHB12733]
MYDKMPLRMIAVTCLGIWIYLRTWWTGKSVPVEKVIEEIDIKATYNAVVNQLLQFETTQPQVCEEMQRKLTARVRAHGVVGGSVSGPSFIELD